MHSLLKAYTILSLGLVLPLLAIGTSYLGSLIRPDMLMAYYAIAGLAFLTANDHRSTRRAGNSVSRTKATS